MPIIPILMYHSISNGGTRGFREFTLTPALFAAHIAYLCAQGYSILSVAGLVELRKKSALPAKPVVLTFDDGFTDFYTAALPVLEQYHAHASLFIPTRYLNSTSLWLKDIGEGQRPMISRAQLVEIANAGVDCGAHTHSHCHLDTVNESQGRRELTQSKETLEQIIGQAVTTFAYPYGHHHTQARQWVVDAGFQAACAVKNALSHSDDDLFALARITITQHTDVNKLAALLKGQGLSLASSDEQLIAKLYRQYRLFRKHFEKKD